MDKKTRVKSGNSIIDKRKPKTPKGKVALLAADPNNLQMEF